jgi:hypothetical protein
MANYYVRSTNGSNGTGSTWATAKSTVGNALSSTVKGDIVYVSQDHYENPNSQNWTGDGGANGRYSVIYGVLDSSQPPTTFATSTMPVIDIYATAGFNIYNGILVRNVHFKTNFVGGSGTFSVYNAELRDCKITAVGTGPVLDISSADNNAICKLTNTTIKFDGSATGNAINLNQCGMVWSGGGIDPTSTKAITRLFNGTLTGRSITLKNLDLSSAATNFNFFANGGYKHTLVVEDCKLPSGWTGGFISTFPVSDNSLKTIRWSLYNCMMGSVKNRLFIQTWQGTIRINTDNYKTAGATDADGTPISLRLDYNNNSDFDKDGSALTTDPIRIWNDNIGSPITLSMDFVHDSITPITDKELWLEITHPDGTISTEPNILGSATDHPSSSAEWTTSGFTDLNKQTLSTTFTPTTAGLISVVVCMRKANKIIFVDPKVTIQ